MRKPFPTGKAPTMTSALHDPHQVPGVLSDMLMRNGLVLQLAPSGAVAFSCANCDLGQMGYEVSCEGCGMAFAKLVTEIDPTGLTAEIARFMGSRADRRLPALEYVGTGVRRVQQPGQHRPWQTAPPRWGLVRVWA